MKQEFCMTCNDIITPVLSTRKEMHNFKGEEFTIDAKVASCPVCGDEFITPESHDVNLSVLQTAYRKKHDLLTTAEIKAIREQYGITQVGFALVLGLGEKTINRYENGYVPDEGLNNLIKLIRIPSNFRDLFEKNKTKLSEAEQAKVDARLKQLEPISTYDCTVIDGPDTTWPISKDQYHYKKDRLQMRYEQLPYMGRRKVAYAGT